MEREIDREKLVYRKKVSAIVVNSNNEFLLIQKPSYDGDFWDFPGGGVDESETSEEALMRELKEELGTESFDIMERSDVVNQYEYPDNVVEQVLKKGQNFRGQQVLQFITRFIGKESDIKIDEEEISKYIWVKPEELEKYMNFEGQFENIKEVLERSNLALDMIE